LNISNFYSTVEISVLGHYLPDSVNVLKDFFYGSRPKASVRAVLNGMAGASISASKRILFWEEL